MTRKLLIFILAAFGLGILVQALRLYSNRVLRDLDATLLKAHAPLTDPGLPDSWEDWTFDHDNIAPVYGYQNFSHTPIPGSSEAFRAAFNPGESTGPAAEARRRIRLRWDEEMGR